MREKLCHLTNELSTHCRDWRTKKWGYSGFTTMDLTTKNSALTRLMSQKHSKNVHYNHTRQHTQFLPRISA